MKRLRIVVIAAVMVVAVAAVVRISAAPAPAATGTTRSTVADTTRVSKGDVQITVLATGPLQANQNVILSFPTNGIVKTINVSQGDYVRKGQTLATLDPQSLTDDLLVTEARLAVQQVALEQLTAKPRPVDIQVVQTQLNQAQAALASANSSGISQTTKQLDQLNVQTAQNALYTAELARDAVNNQRATLAAQPPTGHGDPTANLPSNNQENASLNSAGYDVQIAQGQLAADQSKGGNVGSIASAQAQITSAQVALNNLLNGPDQNDLAKAQANVQSAQGAVGAAKTALAQATLFAPFDGLVAQLNLNIGEQPASSPVIFLDTSSFYVDVPVTENDVTNVKVEQPVQLTFDSLPGVTVNGQVIQVGKTGSTTSGVVTYTVRVQVKPAGQRLYASMTATASIITNQVTNVIRVPNRFIQLDRTTGNTYAYVQQADGSSQQVPVTLGLRNDTYSEVSSGLSVGQVLTAPPATGGSSSSGQGSRPGGPGGPAGLLRLG